MKRFNGYDHLPDNYHLVWHGDFKEDKNLFWLLNIGSFVLLILFIILYFILKANDISPEGIFCGLILSLLIVVLHELVHGIFFKMGKNVKIKFGFHGFAASCSAPNVFLAKKHYMIVGLAPAVIINLCLLIPLFFVQGFVFDVLFWALAIHFGGCIGDFYISIKLTKQPADILIRDYGIGMEFYAKKEESN